MSWNLIKYNGNAGQCIKFSDTTIAENGSLPNVHTARS